VTVTLGASDATSGVAASYYSLDGGATWQTYSAPFDVTTQGSTTVEFYSVDTAGNSETVELDSVLIDGVPPITTAGISGTAGTNGWYTSASVSISLNAGDSTSGVDATYYAIDGGSQ